MSYALGVFCAIMSGTMNACGAILQKSVVNRMSVEKGGDSFMSQLLRSPAWVLSLVITFGLGTVFTLYSQSLIGPALVPGLAASGMIVLAIGSVRLIGEKLRPTEMLGIVLMVLGVFLLSYSNLSLSSDELNLSDRGLLLRIGLFTVVLGLCWLLFLLLAQRARDLAKGLTLAFSGGFLYGLSNLWIMPLLVTIGLVFAGTAQTIQVIVFVISCVMLVTTNTAAIRQVQEAYRFAPASKVQPIQHVPTQIVPILIYYMVFQRSASGVATVLVPVSVALILISGFLLARRKAELDSRES